MLRALRVAAAALALAAPSPAPLTVDLDGDGRPETVIVSSSGASPTLEVRGARGEVLAMDSIPVPSAGASIALATGSLGSSGALLEVAAVTRDAQCRSVWRFREGRLARLPIRDGANAIEDCPDKAWTSHWIRRDPKVPAAYVRERTRRLPEGVHHEMQVFRFEGFALALDPALSRSEIRGVAIPVWSDALLYAKPDLEPLYSRFDLSRLKSAPRLRIRADRAQGVFALQLAREGSPERTLPVVSSKRGEDTGEFVLAAKSKSGTVRARVIVGTSGVPIRAAIGGAGGPFDGFYSPAVAGGERALEVFPSAEDELAVHALAGDWSSETGERIHVSLVSAFPARLEFGGSEVSLSIARAPQGVDLLLVPADGSAPTAGIVLLGPDRIGRVGVLCSEPDSSTGCRAAGPREAFRRIGSRFNGS